MSVLLKNQWTWLKACDSSRFKASLGVLFSLSAGDWETCAAPQGLTLTTTSVPGKKGTKEKKQNLLVDEAREIFLKCGIRA